MHVNRQNIGKFWPIPRKGTKYLAVSSHNQKSSIPLIVVMRDILKLVRTKKELKLVINKKEIKINGKEIRDTNYPIGFFDIISIESLKKNYRASLGDNKKIVFEEVPDNEAVRRTFKIIGKKVLGKDKIQLNLVNGRNVLTKEKANVDDSAVFNFNENKIEKIVKLEKGNQVFVLKGKHTGKRGKIEDVVERGGKKLIVIDGKDGKVNVWVKNVIVMDM